MKAIIFLLVSLAFSSYGQSQLLGTVQKRFSVGNKELVEGHETNVRLYNLSNKAWSNYYSTDSKGGFSIQNLTPGKYLLQVNDPMVKDKNIVFVEVTASGKNIIHPIVVDRIQRKTFIKKLK